MPSILVPASTRVEGEMISRTPAPPAAAAPAIAIPARNLRRFRYRLLGVISDERISSAFLISIWNPSLLIYVFPPHAAHVPFHSLSLKTQPGGKSCKR